MGNVKITPALLIATLLLSGCMASETPVAAPIMNAVTTDTVVVAAVESDRGRNENRLTQELENYIEDSFADHNLLLEATYSYRFDQAPYAEAWLPLEGMVETEWKALTAVFYNGIEEIDRQFCVNVKDASENVYALLSFDVASVDGESGYMTRLYCFRESKLDVAIRYVSKVSLRTLLFDDERQESKSGIDEELLIGDVFNSQNFDNVSWKITESFTSTYPWQIMFQGYVQGGAQRGMMVVMYLLYDGNARPVIPIYIGYLNADYSIEKEASADECSRGGIAEVVEELIEYIPIRGRRNSASLQQLGESNDNGALKNLTKGMQISEGLELIDGPHSKKSGGVNTVTGTVRLTMPSEDVIGIIVNFYDKNELFLGRSVAKLPDGMGRLDKAEFAITYNAENCYGYKISEIRYMSKYEYTKLYTNTTVSRSIENERIFGS